MWSALKMLCIKITWGIKTTQKTWPSPTISIRGEGVGKAWTWVYFLYGEKAPQVVLRYSKGCGDTQGTLGDMALSRQMGDREGHLSARCAQEPPCGWEGWRRKLGGGAGHWAGLTL